MSALPIKTLTRTLEPPTPKINDRRLCNSPPGPALDDGCAFIDATLHKKSGILLCSQHSIAPAAVLAAAYLCRGGMALGLACRKVSRALVILIYNF